ncbi:MAG: YlbF family regulator [Bacillota bacterium]
MSIQEKAKELAESIKNSVEYKNLKEAKAKLDEDEEAAELLKKLQSKQQKVQMLRQNGQELNESIKNDLKSLHSEMEDNKIVSTFIKYQEDFNKIMEEVNKELSTAIQGE